MLLQDKIKILEGLKDAVGKTITGIRIEDGELWLIMDDDVLVFTLSSVKVNCLGCEEKRKVEI